MNIAYRLRDENTISQTMSITPIYPHDLIIPSDLFVGQSAFIGGSLSVDQDLFVCNDIVIYGDLMIIGDSTHSNVVVSNILIVNGEANFNYITNIDNNLIVTGNTHLNNLTALNDVSLQGRTVIEKEGVLMINGDFTTDHTGIFDINRKATFNAGLNAELTSMMDNLIVGSLNTQSAIFSGPVIFNVPPTFPPCIDHISTKFRSVDVILPDDTEIIPIILNDDNRGYLIDATEDNSYMIHFREDISIGAEWEIYISSNIEISISNYTDKIISISGFIHEDRDSIFIPRVKEYIYHPGDRILCMEPSDIQDAHYIITATSVTTTDIRILFRATFT